MIPGDDYLSEQYPRLFELCATAKKGTFFDTEMSDRLKMYKEWADALGEYERVLTCLDNKSWEYFKQKLLNIRGKHELYGYAHITDCLNEAYGYEYLKKEEYSNIKFIEPIQRKQTPDLRAVSKEGMIVILEVKTIRPSRKQMQYFKNIEEKIKAGTLAPNDVNVFTQEVVLPDVFQEKLKSTIESKRKQLSEYQNTMQNSKIRKILYMIINLDVKSWDKEIRDKAGSFLDSLSDEDNVEIRYYFPMFDRPTA